MINKKNSTTDKTIIQDSKEVQKDKKDIKKIRKKRKDVTFKKMISNNNQAKAESLDKCSRTKRPNTVIKNNNLTLKLNFLMMTKKEKKLKRFIREKESSNQKLFLEDCREKLRNKLMPCIKEKCIKPGKIKS